MAKPTQKTLILLRHAHRTYTHASENSPLSARGQKTARQIAEFVQQKKIKIDLVLSSPRLRCQETVAPLSMELGLAVRVTSLLNESEFEVTPIQKRIKKFLKYFIHSAPRCTLACSHGDWIPMAIGQILGCSFDISKGGWVELKWDGRQWSAIRSISDWDQALGS